MSFFPSELSSYQRHHLSLTGVGASSQDHNQSVFCTLNRFDKTQKFWSSTGSQSEKASEFLMYAIKTQSEAQVDKTAVIYSFIIKVYDPAAIQGSINHLYPPKQAQIEVGFSHDKYHYISPLFDVKPDEKGEQEFFLLPELVVGTHFKINLVGKVFRQDFDGEQSDNLYYTALKYCGLSGRLLSEYSQETSQFVIEAEPIFGQIESEVEDLHPSRHKLDEEEANISLLDFEEQKQFINKNIANQPIVYKARH